MSTAITSIEGVVSVERLEGAEATAQTAPSLLLEVPHGADRRHHYDALVTQLVGDLPEDLHYFFHLNTDVGAWDFGRASIEALLKQETTRAALLVRSLIPRTLIDCNRPATSGGGDLAAGGVTAGIPSYIEHAEDRALLTGLHQQYVTVAEEAYAAVLGGRDGLALVPHTYGPRSLGIKSVGRDIVDQLKWACAPERVDTWPMRAEVDLLTRNEAGECLAPTGAEESFTAAFEAAGFSPKCNDTYYLHPATLGHDFSARYPQQIVCLEVRRDLLVDWDPFTEMVAKPDAVGEVAQAVVQGLLPLLR